ncbi:MAG: hypothetical protein ABMA13_22885 [Chthoniobacteraceae bacterium]
MPDSRFRDASDLPAASHRPDMAGAVDSMEDRLLETIARQSVALPVGMQRPAFNRIVAGVAISALHEAARDGTLRELFGEAEPSTGDLEMVTRVLAELIDAANPRLQAKCLAYVLGLNLNGGKSETEIAREEGVKKATVSKRCIRIREAFGLPPSRGMKQDRARASYRVRQTGRRARPARIEWAFTGLLNRALCPS